MKILPGNYKISRLQQRPARCCTLYTHAHTHTNTHTHTRTRAHTQAHHWRALLNESILQTAQRCFKFDHFKNAFQNEHADDVTLTPLKTHRMTAVKQKQNKTKIRKIVGVVSEWLPEESAQHPTPTETNTGTPWYGSLVPGSERIRSGRN